MRYVIVAERTPKGLPRYCNFCCTKLDNGYLREISTRILYCPIAACYELHVASCAAALGGNDATLKIRHG